MLLTYYNAKGLQLLKPSKIDLVEEYKDLNYYITILDIKGLIVEE